MTSRYEQFNEVTFEAYIKTAIDNSTTKERQRKIAQRQREQNFSDFPDAVILALSREDSTLGVIEPQPMLFEVLGELLPVEDLKLGRALSYLLPKDREIVLLRYFYQMRDGGIALRMNIPRATVQRRRQQAEEKLRKILEELT